MTSINIQFHGLPDEIARFIGDIINEFELYVLCMSVRPFEIKALNDASEIRDGKSRISELALTLVKPDMSVKSGYEFHLVNENSMRIRVERCTSEGLRQTYLSASASDAETLRTWKLIAKRLKKMTRTGVYAINQTTGAHVGYRPFRFTEGAAALADKDVPMLAIAGTVRLFFDRESSDSSR